MTEWHGTHDYIASEELKRIVNVAHDIIAKPLKATVLPKSDARVLVAIPAAPFASVIFESVAKFITVLAASLAYNSTSIFPFAVLITALLPLIL